MKTPGDDRDPLFIEARCGLIDALVALVPHTAKVVLVGAQAIYIHTDEVFTGVALRTKDADLALMPPLDPSPDIDAAMRAASFVPGSQPGIWLNGDRQVDLLVPEALAPRDAHRAARLPGQGHKTLRKVSGIEGAAVDNSLETIRALDAADNRTVLVRVAGPAALLVAKGIKLVEREREPGQRRLETKDAFDVYRLLRLQLSRLIPGFEVMLASDVSAAVAREGITALGRLFGTADAVGSTLAARYVGPAGDGATIQASASLLMNDLLAAMPA
jgi:hypothetical protein